MHNLSGVVTLIFTIIYFSTSTIILLTVAILSFKKSFRKTKNHRLILTLYIIYIILIISFIKDGWSSIKAETSLWAWLILASLSFALSVYISTRQYLKRKKIS